MNITVQAKSGAQSFHCDANQNLLYAGLNAGLSLPYECATGTCGTCKARVAEGEVTERWTDAPGRGYLKPERREILMCQSAPAGDCVLRVVGRREPNPHIPHIPAWQQGRVVNTERLTHDVIAFDLELPQAVDFEAGQFVVLAADGVPGGRAYSMTNFQRSTDRLSFVVKRKPGGGFSNWLFENDVKDESLSMFGPLGRATFHPQEDKNVLCIGGGSGIAGMMSILSRACEEGYFRERAGQVYFGVRTSDDVFFLDTLSDYASAFPENLSVTVALSDEHPGADLAGRFPALRFSHGFVHAAAEPHAAEWSDSIAYVAGPPPMVDAALKVLVLEAQLPASQIRYDKFG